MPNNKDMRNKLQKFSLIIGDIMVLYLSLYLTLLIRYQSLPDTYIWEAHIYPFTFAFGAWIVIFYISDLYNIHLAVNNSKFFNLTLRSVFSAGLLTAFFFYLNPSINIAPKTNLIIYLIIFFIIFLSWRRLYNKLLFSYIPKEKLLIIGYNEKVLELIEVFEQKPHLGYKVAYVIDDKNHTIPNGIPSGLSLLDIKTIIQKQKIGSIILASDPHNSEELRHYLFSLLSLKIKFRSLTDFYETITGKIPIDTISEMWFLEKLSEGDKILFDKIKRFMDVILGTYILVFSFPLWPIFCLLLKLENKESVFFVQKRSGQNNQTFNLIKFRTQKTLKFNPDPSQANDSRNTKVGTFFRKTRIDEIPQVLNIIKGDMSFIGPRPERPEIITKLEQTIPFYRERMLIKPGLTGWAQTFGGYLSPSPEDTIKKLQYDFFYIKNRSLYLDLSITLKTIAEVLKRSGV